MKIFCSRPNVLDELARKRLLRRVVGKGKLSITKKKTIKTLGQIKNYGCRCRPATAKVKSSETSSDLNGYLEPLTHLCTVLNIANERKKKKRKKPMPITKHQYF